MADEIRDLFGDPVPPNHGRRGRPQHIPTAENCNKVRMLLGFGWGNSRIANALSVTEPTLRKHYKFLLKRRDEMRDRMTARLAQRLWQEGIEKGNVGAIREFRKLLGDNDRELTAAHFGDRPDADKSTGDAGRGAGQRSSPNPGKKELQAAAARTAGAGSDWGDDLLPPAKPN